MATQEEISQHLDLSDRQLRNVLSKLKLNHKELSIDEIRVAYIRNLREEAAGRKATTQKQALDEAKTREALANAMTKEMDLFVKQKELVLVAEVRQVIDSWISLSKSEYENSIEKIIAMIESHHGVTIDREQTDGIVASSLRTIGDFQLQPSGTN
jgi:transcriptional antiterminator